MLSLVVLSSILAIACTDSVCNFCSSVTDTPRSRMRSSSPMTSHLTYVWDNWEDPAIEKSHAICELRSLINRELSRTSTTAEITDHINRHFRNPVFTSIGASPATHWRQDAFGYEGLLFDDHKMLHVGYFSKNGKFLFAQLTMGRPKGSDHRHLDLTERVDVWSSPSTAGSN